MVVTQLELITLYVSNVGTMQRETENNMTLEQIRKWAEEISGNWNGDDSGSAEDRAHQANEIIEAVENLEELIKGMEEL